jgi:hypothetical protein
MEEPPFPSIHAVMGLTQAACVTRNRAVGEHAHTMARVIYTERA